LVAATNAKANEVFVVVEFMWKAARERHKWPEKVVILVSGKDHDWEAGLQWGFGKK